MDSKIDHLSEGLEMVLREAAIDDDFARQLVASPEEAAARFELNEVELATLRSVRASTKEELAARLLEAWQRHARSARRARRTGIAPELSRSVLPGSKWSAPPGTRGGSTG